MLNEIYYHNVQIHCTNYGSSIEGKILKEGVHTLDVVLLENSQEVLHFRKIKSNTYVCNKAGLELVINI